MTEQAGGKPGKLMDKSVFGFFEKFTNPQDSVRVGGACALVKFLSKSGADGTKKLSEKRYTLKRLIRGVGATTKASRAGFYTALVALLEEEKGQESCPSIAEIFTLVKSELSDSTGRTKDDRDDSKMELKLGKLLVCGAIVKSGLIENASDEELQTVLKALKKGMYKMLGPLMYSFLIELVQKIDAQRFSKILWPTFDTVLNVPKEAHTVDSLHFLMVTSATHQKVVNQKFFERNFGAPKLLHADNFAYLAQILFDIKSPIAINHHFYDYFVEQLLQSGQLPKFWKQGVGPILDGDDSSFKYRDIVTLRLLLSIFSKLDDASLLPSLLIPSFMKFLVQNLKNTVQLSEDVRSLYQEMFEEFIELYANISDEALKLQLFDTFIQPPSSILVEKYSSCKVLQNLITIMDVSSVQTITKTLKTLVLDGTLTNAERSYAAQTLQKMISLPQMGAEDEWRSGIVNFFLNLGIFYSADGSSVLKSPKLHSKAIAQELSVTLKGLFFHTLEYRHAKLTMEHSFLVGVVKNVYGSLTAYGNKSLRSALTDQQLELFEHVHDLGANGGLKSKQPTNLELVFQVLLLYMGLHLFSDPEVASSSIAELKSVMKRLNSKGRKMAKQQKPKLQVGSITDTEPEWIEVVVDLFLNLMSQNSLLLRKVIGHVFPHLAGEITLTAFNQVLSVINLKDKANPLSAPADEPSENGVEEESSSDEESDDDDSSSEEDGEDGDVSEEEEEDDDDDGFEDDGEESKVTDKMRQAIQVALGGAAPETDTESIDVDDMNEADGHKLDDALAAAFKMFKASKQGAKPTKKDIRMDTTLTHFRMRVFDLIDVYLKHKPNMIICLELMLYIFEMLPVAIKEPKFKAILNRYKQIFNSLIRVKHFNGNAQDVSMAQLSQILSDLVAKVAQGASFPEKSLYLLKACQFLVLCSQTLERNENINGGSHEIDRTFCELLQQFLKDRNPPLTHNIFQQLFRMCWSGNWQLAKTLVQHGLKKDIRALRRIQTLQLVRELLRNRRLITGDQGNMNKLLKSIAGVLPAYLEFLQTNSAEGGAVGQNEFAELVSLLLELHNHATRTDGAKLPLDWKKTGVQIQSLRKVTLNSQAMSNYGLLCRQLKLTPIKNNDLKVISQKSNEQAGGKMMNGHDNGTADVESSDEEDTVAVKQNGAAKRKKTGDAKKVKRLRKEERLKAASEGMEAVSFFSSE